MPKVSVLVNCYNGERYLTEALDSIYAQTHINWEIIFIDNASSDKSAQIVQQYDQRLKYFHLEKNISLYAARNFGLQQVTGEFITFLDVDDIWRKDKLSKQLAIMEKNPQVYLISTAYFRKNEHLGTCTRARSFRSKFINFTEAVKSYPIAISSTMLRRDQHSQPLLQFNSSLNLTGDYELFLKVIHQFPTYYLADPVVTLRVHPDNLSSRLVLDWPRETAETHARLIEELSPTPTQIKLMHKRHAKASALVHLANKNYPATRTAIQAYFLRDIKISLIYLSTFNLKLAQWILKVRGF